MEAFERKGNERSSARRCTQTGALRAPWQGHALVSRRGREQLRPDLQTSGQAAPAQRVLLDP